MKYIGYTIAAAAVLLSACQKELSIYETIEDDLKITASTEKYDNSTKTFFSNGDILWNSGDRVVALIEDVEPTYYVFTVADEFDGKSSATLTKPYKGSTMTPVAVENNIAFYPYPFSQNGNLLSANGDGTYTIPMSCLSIQKYVQDGFTKDTYPMVAINPAHDAGNTDFAFKNVLGGIKLQLKGDIAVRSIIVMGNNDEIISGDMDVTVSYGNEPSVAMTSSSSFSKQSVTLDCGKSGVQLNNSTPTNFILLLPPTNMTRGFSVTIIDTEGGMQQLSSAANQTINRSRLLKMPVLTVSTSKEVDLGLPSELKWATINVGANSMESIGDYFAWGATVPFYSSMELNSTYHSMTLTFDTGMSYNLVNTPYQVENTTNYTAVRFSKYLGSTTSTYKHESATDEDALKTVLDLCDDAANANWGGDWRMPTKDDCTELMNNCTKLSVSGFCGNSNLKGYVMRSNNPAYHHKWIFLHYSGMIEQKTYKESDTYGARYWTSNVRTDDPRYATLYHVNNSSLPTNYYRRTGIPIRPVR